MSEPSLGTSPEFQTTYGHESRLPARLTAYKTLVDYLSSRLDEVNKQPDGNKTHYENGLFFDDLEPIPGALPSLGVGACIPQSITFLDLQSESFPLANKDSHYFIEVALSLYKDGKPQVLDGDSYVEGSIFRHDYYAIFPREGDPYLIHSAHAKSIDSQEGINIYRNINPDQLANARKHLLTDEDCESIVAMLQDLPVATGL